MNNSPPNVETSKSQTSINQTPTGSPHNSPERGPANSESSSSMGLSVSSTESEKADLTKHKEVTNALYHLLANTDERISFNIYETNSYKFSYQGKLSALPSPFPLKIENG
jgi:hypothetical protein